MKTKTELYTNEREFQTRIKQIYPTSMIWPKSLEESLQKLKEEVKLNKLNSNVY